MRPALTYFRLFIFLLAVTLGQADVSFAQVQGLSQEQSLAAPPQPQRLDSAIAELDQIGQTLKRTSLSDAMLRELRGRLDPLSQVSQSLIEDLTPRLAAAKARLDQLGPKPAAGAPAEALEVASEREDQQKLFNEIDGRLKRARLLAVDIEDTQNRINSRRRDLFRHALFAQSFSILNPNLWIAALAELPREFVASSTILMDWISLSRAQLEGWKWAAFLAGLMAIAAASIGFGILARRVLSREDHEAQPSRLLRAFSALWVAMIIAAVPIAAVQLLLALMSTFNLSNVRLMPLLSSLAGGVALVATTMGFVRGVVAPDRPNWRILDIGDRVAGRVEWIAVTVALIVAITRLIDAFDDVISASVPVSVLVRGLSAILVAAVMSSGLYGLLQSEDVIDEECLGPIVTAPKRDWYGVIRIAAWICILLILGAVAIGYVAFAAFLIDQMVWVAFVGTLAFLIQILVNDGFEIALQPHAPIGRGLISSLGLRRESLDQISVLVTGLANLALFVGVLILALAPWGVESDDMMGAMKAAFFGFQLGDVTISLSTLVLAMVLFAGAIGATRVVQHWLEVKFLPRTQLDIGLRNSIRTSIGYLGFMIAASLALANLGLSFERIAIVAGALSVGIGFGLQSIVNNFVSGLILLWERAIRVGDLVYVGDEQGHVRRINVRSTEIETADRAMMIVPNSNLVSGVVKNWVRADRIGRVKIALSLDPKSDPEEVRAMLQACAKAHGSVMQMPAPIIFFTGISEANLKFEFICFVADVEIAGRVKSDLHFAIHKAMAKLGMKAKDDPPEPGAPRK